MTEPPYECPTRTTGLLTRFRVLFTLATSSASESSPCWLAITSCPSARRVGINLLKQEIVAQDGRVDAGPERITSGEERRAARRALGHCHHVRELHAGPDDGVDVGQ